MVSELEPKLAKAGDRKAESATAAENNVDVSRAKPLTAQEKVKAITPTAAKDETPSKTAYLLQSQIHAAQIGGCLPIAHRSGRAPAAQQLELCHGESTPLFPFSQPFHDERFRMLITDLF